MLISLSKESTKITYSATSFGFKNVLKSWSVEIFPISVFVEDGEMHKTLTFFFFNSIFNALYNPKTECLDAQYTEPFSNQE